MAKSKKEGYLKEIVTQPYSPTHDLDSMNWLQKHKIAFIMLFSALVLLGVISFNLIPVSLYPETSYPGLTIETEYYGVGPEKIEEIITKPLEESVSILGGIEQIFSISEEGKSKVHILFDQNADLDSKSLEIRDKVEQVSAFFPRETQKPIVLHYDPSQKPAFIIVPKSKTLNLMDLREISDREIKKIIEGVSGITEVIVAGGKPREIHISCDHEKMVGYGIGMKQILNQLQEANLNDTSGEVQEGINRIPIHVKGRLKNLKQIESITLKSENSGRQVKISDIAKVSYSYREDDSAARVNGENTVSIYVYRSGTSNLLNISSQLLNELKKAETPDLKFEISFNQSDTIIGAIRNFLVASIIGFSLFVFGFYLLLGKIKTAVIIILLLLGQFFISSIFIYFAGIDYNLVTISGLVLSVGCSLAIFLSGLIFSQSSPISKGIQFIKSESLYAILLIAGVFLPVLFATKELKTVYGGLGFVLVTSFLLSFFTLIIFFPLLEDLIKIRKNELPTLEFSKEIKIDIKQVPIFLKNIEDYFINKSLYILEKFQTRPSFFLIFYLLICLLCLILFSASNHEFVNKVEEKQLVGNLEFPSGTSFTKINETALKVETLLSDRQGIKEINSRIEAGQASIVVKFFDSMSDVDELGKELEELVGNIKPAFIYFSGGNDEATLKEITIDVIGDDLALLDKIVRSVSSKAQEISPNVRHVLLRYKPPREEVQVVIDKDKGERSGITAQEIGQSVRFGVQGGVATKFLEDGREIDVRIQYEKDFRDKISDIKDYQVTNENGDLIPLMEISTLVRGTTPVRIYRKNKRRVLSFSMRFSDSNISDIIDNLNELKQIPLPEHYRVEFSEQLNKVIENKQRINYILGFASLVLFMLLASFLESLQKPFLLLSVIPFPIFSILLCLFILKLPITVPVYLGVIIISALSVFETFLLMKKFEYWKMQSSELERISLSNDFVEVYSDFVRRFSKIWSIAGLFYIPQIFIFGVGSSLIKTISVTIVAGLIGIIIFVPLIFIFVYLYPNRIKYSFNEIIVFVKFLYTRHIRPKFRSLS